MIKAMSAPYTSVKFMPTGGINADNLNEYLSFGKIVACGGSWMVKKEPVAAGEFDKITALTKEAVSKMLGFEMKHIGINENSEGAALGTAKAFADMFGLETKNGNSSVFAGPGIEITKSPSFGTHGHIAVGTNFIERAVYHLERQGVEFDRTSEKRDAKGNLKAVYLKGEFSGFAVHLVQK